MAFDLSKIISSIKYNLSTQLENQMGGKRVVGVDIGSSTIKVVQIHNNRGVPTLDTYGELQLGPYDEIEIGRTTDLSVVKLTQAFVDILRESNVTAKNVALAISYKSSFATIINVSTNNPEEVDGLVSLEAKKYIPVHLNTVTLDWFSIGMDSENESTKVLLAAIYNDALKKSRVIIESATLKIVSTEIEIFSSVRSSVVSNDDVVALIDFGAIGTRLYITKKGIVTKIHSLQMSGHELTKLIANTLKLDFNKSEELKRNGMNDIPVAKKVVFNVVERGLREIGQVIKRYEGEDRVKVSKIILAGGGSLLQDLSANTQDMLNKPVIMSDPFSKVAYPAFLEDTLTEAGPSFSVAVGAALQSFLIGK